MIFHVSHIVCVCNVRLQPLRSFESGNTERFPRFGSVHCAATYNLFGYIHFRRKYRKLFIQLIFNLYLRFAVQLTGRRRKATERETASLASIRLDPTRQ